MAENGNNNLADLGSHGRRWLGARGEAAQKALATALQIALKRLDAQLVQLFDQLDDTLFVRADKAADAGQHDQYFNALRDVRLLRADMLAGFSALLTRVFEQGRPRDMEIPRELSLCTEDDDPGGHDSAEEDLAVASLVRKVRGSCADSLGVLDRRMGFLLEDPELECWQNPLGPEVLCDAFRQVAERIEADLVIRLIIFKLFDQYVITQLKEIYKEIDYALLQLGVLPTVKLRATKSVSAGSMPMAPGIVPSQTSKPLDPPVDAVQMAPGIVPAKQVERTVSNSETIVMAAGIEIDPRSTLSVPQDNLAATVPMAPGIVPSGLATKPVPAADSVPMAPGIVPSGYALRPVGMTDSVSTADDQKTQVVESMQVTIVPEPEKETIAQPESPTPSDTLREEKMKAAQQRLQDAEITAVSMVEASIGNGSELGMIKAFVAGHWKELLKLVCVRDGKGSPAWKQTVATMDDLLWSVKPKRNEQECERLRVIQPRLIHNLRQGMQRLSLAPGERDAFIDTLAQIHSAFLTEKESCEEKIEVPVLDTETEEEVEAAADTVTRKRPINRPRHESNSGLKDWRNGDQYTSMANRLTPGDWVEFSTAKGTVTHAKLSWNSPITNTLLFTDRQGLQAGNYTLDEFARMLRLSRARVLSRAERKLHLVKTHG